MEQKCNELRWGRKRRSLRGTLIALAILAIVVLMLRCGGENALAPNTFYRRVRIPSIVEKGQRQIKRKKVTL